VVEFSDAFFGQIDSIRFTGCFIDEGKRWGKTFDSIISSSGSEGRANALGQREKGRRHKIESIVSPFDEHIVRPISLGASAIFKWSLKAGPVS
jgi:hypothetical protein